MSARQLVTDWVKHFNNCDAEKLARLYHVDAVNQQVADVTLNGRDEILDAYEGYFERQEMVCIAETIHESVNGAILEWRDPTGDLRGCCIFTIRAGKITFQRDYWDMLHFREAVKKKRLDK